MQVHSYWRYDRGVYAGAMGAGAGGSSKHLSGFHTSLWGACYEQLHQEPHAGRGHCVFPARDEPLIAQSMEQAFGGEGEPVTVNMVADKFGVEAAHAHLKTGCGSASTGSEIGESDSFRH